MDSLLQSKKIIIKMEGLSKRFTLQKQNPFLLRQVLNSLLRKHQKKDSDLWAVKDLTATVYEGEAVGIIGSNGSGKSTLLSLLAGSVYPSKGSLDVNGRIGALLELGAGFHTDLTGRENIYLNASLLGLSRSEIEAKYEHVVEFSELGHFIDVQIRNYSSGMLVRLAFSVAVHIDPQIILIDEALAVGDRHFQEKCVERIMGFKNEKRTLIFVSHSMELVKLVCDRVFWMREGKLILDGSPQDVIPKYQEYSDDFQEKDTGS